MNKSRKNRSRIRWGRVIIAFIIISAVVFAILKVIPGGTYKCTTNNLELNFSTKAVLIRDEKGYYLGADDDEFSRIEYVVNEGERVVQGQNVAVTYKMGYTDEVLQKLYNIQQEIYEEQLSLLSGVNKPEVTEIQSTIDELINYLRDSNNNNKEIGIKELEIKIKKALSNRNALLRSMVQPSETLEDLYKQEQNRLDQIKGWTNNVIAAEDGIFSCYSDGNEQSLSLEKQDIISASQLNKVAGEKGYDASMGENDSGFMYRIIDDSHFAIGIVTDSNDLNRLYTSEKYLVNFNGVCEFEGTCISNKINKDKCLAIIMFNENVSKFINMRTVDVTISARYTGIRVDKDAIRFDKQGKTYVNLVKNGTTEKIYVDVLANTKLYVIIRATDNNINFEPGQCFKSYLFG